MYIVKKITKLFSVDGNEPTTHSEHLGFVATPEEFNIYLNNNYSKPNFAMTPPDIKTYGMGSKAVTIVDLDKINCPMESGVVFTIVSQQDKKLI